MITLFFGPNTCALASLIAMHESGLEFELRILNMKGLEQRSPEYLAVNPKGRVPALVTDKGILTETPAILAYIAQQVPEKNLAPLNDPFAFAQMQSFNSYLCSTVHVAHAHRMRGSRWADETTSHEDMRRKVPGNIAECFRLIEGEMLKSPWVMGEQYTVADPYLFTISNWLEIDGVDIADFPRVHDHFNRMMERPAVATAMKIARGDA